MSDNMYRKKIYYPALDSLKIDRRPPHTCRHTFATLMSRAGVDHQYIQRIMGHSSYSFTADNYSHPQIKELKNAISKIIGATS
jgi:integrase